MARIINPLTDSKVKNAKPGFYEVIGQEENDKGKLVDIKKLVTNKDKSKLFKTYTLFDGGGLYMEVTPSGSKRWRIKYSFNGKNYKKTLGLYPAITLGNARTKRDKAKGSIANGIDPFPAKAKATDSNGKTFKWFTEWYFNGDPRKKKDIPVSAKISEGHRVQVEAGWTNRVLPAIGEKAMTDVTPADIVKIMQDIKGTPSLARKIFASTSRLYSLAIVNYPDEITTNPCQHVKIGDILAHAEKKHYPIITEPKELKKLLLTIEDYDKPKYTSENSTKPKRGSTSLKRMLTLLSYTFVRPKNAREAMWSEFDLDAARWVIPKEKMKSDREHIVPLATQVVKMLRVWKEESTHDRVFPGQSGGNSTISTAAPSAALHRMGFDIVAHSFRGIFSTIANEENEENADLYTYSAIETQLAHVVGDATARSYNRAMYIKERTKMMQWYANYIDEIKNG